MMNTDTTDRIDALALELLLQNLPEAYLNSDLDNINSQFMHFRGHCERLAHAIAHGLPEAEELDRDITLLVSLADNCPRKADITVNNEEVDNLAQELLAARLPEAFAGQPDDIERQFAHFRERCEMFLHNWEHGLPDPGKLAATIAVRASYATPAR